MEYVVEPGRVYGSTPVLRLFPLADQDCEYQYEYEYAKEIARLERDGEAGVADKQSKS